MLNRRVGWSLLAGATGALAMIGLVQAGIAAHTAPYGFQVQDPNYTPPNAVVTGHNDNARTGMFTIETKLTPNNVFYTIFGKLFSDSVDGFIYAQPLYVPGVTIAGKVHNVVYVCTEHDSVYAFDADASGGALWMTSFTKATGVTSVPSADTGSGDIVPEIGITATPVINYMANTIYVEAKTKEVVGTNVNYVHRIHALDIRTGLEMPHSPIVINASVPGTGDGNNGQGQVPWNPLRQHVRPALLLANGVLYVASASHGDNGPYHGWIFGYQAGTLKQLYVLNVTPNGGLGGFWQAGGGLAADKLGNIFGITGNGTFTADPSLGNGIDYGDSYLKMAPVNGSLKILDYFSPYNQAFLDAVDADLGSGGCLIPPTQSGAHPNIIVGCGKEGWIYVINRDNMSHFHAAGDQVLQALEGAVGGTWSSPAYWNNNIYYNGVNDVLKCFSLSGGKLSTSPIAQSKVGIGFPGATPSVSANGTTNGLVWIIDSSAYGSNGPAILHCFNATTLKEIYNSAQAPKTRDIAGAAVKFSVPTVTTGKVYVGTQKELDVYGPL